ncbi:MAG: M20 family metallo-hydrolase [Desulfovibrionaceae bacterium]|nr:M20 family metallo-hydrolase [Desulfovibrionaceae bacterium]
MTDKIFKYIDGLGPEVAALQTLLVSIPALGPKNGGDGEKAKAEQISKYLRSLGLKDIREFRSPDPSVSCGYRPNLAAVTPGRNRDKTLWIISHLDVVPPGDPALWDSDPYALKQDGDIIIGRGVEDNHQGMVSSLMAAKALKDLDITPDINLGLLLVADEETGNAHGLEYLVREQRGLFNENDLYLVPDFGLPSSEMVEVAEKSMLWLKFTVTGRQCHASTPAKGLNSLVAASALILDIQNLHNEFDKSDPLFDPPCSTFTPTKKEANVENVNTIPGRDVFYVDCRVLADYGLDRVGAAFKDLARKVEARYGVKVDIEPVLREQAAPATPLDSEIVCRLIGLIRRVYGCDPKPQGIGGGTVAAYLRRLGLPAAVWSTLVGNAHQPNEKSSIAYTLGDAKVMAGLLFE